MAEKESSKDERIGYHKGALNTLLGERAELVRMIQQTDALVQAHAQELEKLGIKLSQNNK